MEMICVLYVMSYLLAKSTRSTTAMRNTLAKHSKPTGTHAQIYIQITGNLLPYTCLNVRGLASVNTSSQQNFVENFAISSNIGLSACPFSVRLYSIRIGVSL